MEWGAALEGVEEEELGVTEEEELELGVEVDAEAEVPPTGEVRGLGIPPGCAPVLARVDWEAELEVAEEAGVTAGVEVEVVVVVVVVFVVVVVVGVEAELEVGREEELEVAEEAEGCPLVSVWAETCSARCPFCLTSAGWAGAPGAGAGTGATGGRGGRLLIACVSASTSFCSSGVRGVIWVPFCLVYSFRNDVTSGPSAAFG